MHRLMSIEIRHTVAISDKMAELAENNSMPTEEPTTFSREGPELYAQGFPLQPYISFQIDPRKIKKLVVKIWSNDQGN